MNSNIQKLKAYRNFPHAMKQDLIASVVCILFGVFIIYKAKDFPWIPGSFPYENPAFYPDFLSIVLIFLGILYLILTIRRFYRGSHYSVTNVQQVENRYLKIVILVASSVFITYLMKQVGFFWTGSVFVLGSMILIRPTRGGKNLFIYFVIAGMIILIIYITFEIMFGVPLPRFEYEF